MYNYLEEYYNYISLYKVFFIKTIQLKKTRVLSLSTEFLGGNLYPFASETSPMLYENDWYFSRLEPPFLLPESLFMRS